MKLTSIQIWYVSKGNILNGSFFLRVKAKQQAFFRRKKPNECFFFFPSLSKGNDLILCIQRWIGLIMLHWEYKKKTCIDICMYSRYVCHQTPEWKSLTPCVSFHFHFPFHIEHMISNLKRRRKKSYMIFWGMSTYYSQDFDEKRIENDPT